MTKDILKLFDELNLDPAKCGFIYIHGDMEQGEVISRMFGDLKVLGDTIGSGITGIDNFRNIILAAVCDYLRTDEQQKKLFIDALQLPGMSVLAN